MKTRYEFVGTSVPYVLGSVVLYGDRDDETDRLLMAMLREALAVSAVRGGRREVIVRAEQLDL